MADNYDRFFASGSWPLPCAVCAQGDWTLHAINHGLALLLGTSQVKPEPDALNQWLAAGSLEAIPFSDRPDVCSRLFFRQNNGRSFLVQWWPIGEDKYLRCVVIHELPAKYLERTAQRSLRELDSILEFIHDGIWVIDSDGITRRINRAMERIAGIKAEEVVGRHVSEPLREGRFKTCVTLKALEERQTVTLFDDYANGRRCLNTSTPVLDQQGQVWRVIAAIRDMTELEELQQKLSSVEVEALAHRMRAQGLENEAQSGLLGQSAALRRVLQDIGRAAQSDAVTLISGETGTGKTLAAKIIHEKSGRSQKPFVAINCGAIPPSLMESELFGYERGAFTGAAKNGKPGMIELATGGTLLLDEIGELSLPMQARLLHVLDGQPVYRVGSTRPFHANARILAATNRPLAKMVAEGTFRQDLFYRLAVLCMEMPPLRERQEDILQLAWHFLLRQGNGKRLSPEVEQIFMRYDWPGNVRELQSVVQSLATLCDGNVIMPHNLPATMRPKTEPYKLPPPRTSLPEAVASLEKEMIQRALINCRSTYKAAAALGISQSQVVRKAKKYGITAQITSTGDNQ